MQIRYATQLSDTEYVSRHGWVWARLESCPVHPEGGCSFHRHGTYTRRRPEGTRIARWYCRESHRTFSLLPDCFASRYSGSLSELEEAVAELEIGSTVDAAAEKARPMGREDSVTPLTAKRWLERRAKLLYASLYMIISLLPSLFAEFRPTVTDFRSGLGVSSV